MQTNYIPWKLIEIEVQKEQPHYNNPEQCLHKAQQLNSNGRWQEALCILHNSILNKRSRSNLLILEKLMRLMIDICTQNLDTNYLKQDVDWFRNQCQHSQLDLLKNILKYLRNESEKVYLQLEKEFGAKELQKVFSEENDQVTLVNDIEASADDLLLMAYCNLDKIEQKSRVTPKINFFIETFKIILDTLRSNSRLLEFYNETARKVFKFCYKYKNKREYKKISETLHSHFNQILKYDKQQDSASKIPYPIKLNDDDQVTLILTLRKEQLELSLGLEEWTDAHKTSNNIYALMKKSSKSKTQQQINLICQEFYQHLASIFWESKLYLFHSYALQNVQFYTNLMKNLEPQHRREINDRFVLAVLSIPLNNKVSNFEPLAFQFVPESMKEFDIKIRTAKEDLLDMSKILQLEGLPSRNAIIHQIYIDNIHRNTSEQVSELFNLVEHEESPMAISKKGKTALESLCTEFPNFEKYKPFIAKSLSVRILQKCKTFYANMKLSKLLKLLQFYDNLSEVESLLYECNREGLLYTTLNYHAVKGEAFLTFNPEAQVAENLAKFGDQLCDVFQQVRMVTTKGQSQRERFFGKAKDKIDDEVRHIREEQQRIQEAQQALDDNMDRKRREEAERQRKLKVQQETDQKNQQKIDGQRKERAMKMMELEIKMMERAKQVIQMLSSQKGIKKIGKIKITDMLSNEKLINYETINEFWQNLMKKEKESIEENKNKKKKDVELWARSLREEERVNIIKYANTNAEREMEQISETMRDKKEAEMKDQEQLATASDFYRSKMDAMMAVRHQIWEQKKQRFINEKMEQLKKSIIDSAESELFKEENKKIQERLQEERRRKDRERELKEKAEMSTLESPTKVGADPESEGWSKGSLRQPTVTEESPTERPRPARGGGDNSFITRSDVKRNQTKPEEQKEPDSGMRRNRPKQSEDDNTGFQRGNFRSKKDEDGPKKEGGGPPRFTRDRGDRGAGGDKKPEGGDGGFGGLRSNKGRKK